MAADHVADVQLGQFVVGQVEHREALLGQAGISALRGSFSGWVCTPTKMCASLPVL
jgi:hypothetical protein